MAPSFADIVESRAVAVVDDDERFTEDTDPLASDFKGIKALMDRGMSLVPTKYLMPNEDATRIADIPIVDMGSPNVLHDLHKACTDSGIFYVVNHGVEIKPVMQSALEFFKLPDEVKMQLWTENLFDPIRYCTSMTPSLEKRLEWHDHLQMWFPEQAVDDFVWPDAAKGLRKAGTNYVKGLLSLGNQMLKLMSTGLGLKESAMKDAYGTACLLMRANYYPTCPSPRLALGMDGHTDSGGVTMLLQDEVGGLQIIQEGEWCAVKPMEGSFVVNMGDQIEKLTNGRYKSVLHRVMVHPTRSRLSIASFISPAPDSPAEIAPIPELLSEEKPAKYTRLPYRAYINEVYTKHFAGKNVY